MSLTVSETELTVNAESPWAVNVPWPVTVVVRSDLQEKSNFVTLPDVLTFARAGTVPSLPSGVEAAVDHAPG